MSDVEPKALRVSVTKRLGRKQRLQEKTMVLQELLRRTETPKAVRTQAKKVLALLRERR